MTASKILFLLCISFIVGIALQSLIKIPQIFVWGFLLFGICIIIFSFKRFPVSNFGVWGFCLLFFILGILRLQVVEFSINNDKLSLLNDRPEKITLTGTIIAEPDVRENSQQLKFQVTAYGGIPSEGGKKNTNSVVLITTNRYPEYQYLETITITGVLKAPPEFEGFSYKNYLMKDGIYSVMGFPKIVSASQNGSQNIFEKLYGKLLDFKKALKQSIAMNFAPPQSFILEGLILGSDANMPDDVQEKLSTTGLSHLTAISGSNVLILSTIMVSFMLFLGFWRGQAFYISTAFIWLYIIIAGLPASGIRAAIMATVFLLAQKLGRQNASSRVIVLAASIMLLQNPLLLLHDIGFQLSFMASMGIIHLKPIIDGLLKFKKDTGNFIEKVYENKRVKNLLDIFSVTLSAQLFTLPIIAYHFKNVSIIALLTNMLILPFVDLIMVFGFLSVFLGIFSNILGFIFSLPAWALLSYFMGIVEVFSKTWAVIPFERTSIIWIIAYYVVVIYSIWFLNRKLKPKFLGF